MTTTSSFRSVVSRPSVSAVGPPSVTLFIPVSVSRDRALVSLRLRPRASPHERWDGSRHGSMTRAGRRASLVRVTPRRGLVGPAGYAADAEHPQTVRSGRERPRDFRVNPSKVLAVKRQSDAVDVDRSRPAQRHVQLLLS